jgi:hypothetical protein
VVLNIYYEHLASAPDADFPLAITSGLTCEQVGLGVSLLTATIPNLKSFVMSFDTSMMMNISHRLPHKSSTTSTANGSSQRYLNSSDTTKRSNSTPSSNIQAPHLSDLAIGDTSRHLLRPEQLENFTRIEAFQAQRDDHPTHQDGRIGLDVGWQVDKSQI